MADIQSFRNRLKLKDASARKLAIFDLQRVAVADRDAATEILLAHLQNETVEALRHQILELLIEWKGKQITPALEQLATGPHPALAAEAQSALDYLQSLQ